MAIKKTSTTELSDIFNEVIKEGVVNLTTAVRNRPLLAILMKGKDNKSRVNANVKVGSFDKDTKTFKIKSVSIQQKVEHFRPDILNITI